MTVEASGRVAGPPARRTGARIRCCAVTDLGLERSSNQDAAFVRSGDGLDVLAVADGMGGAPAGDRASALVIAAFERRPAPGEPPHRYLEDAVARGAKAIAADVASHPQRAGMGSTVVAAIVREGEAWVAHVGDSRAYLWRDGALRRLTDDHSVVAEELRGGRLDATEARDSPWRHLITRVVGGLSGEPDLGGPFPVDDRSVLLLVTDGVCGVLEDAQIAAAIAEHRGAATARALIQRVHEAGAPDNIGIALLDERG